MLFCAAAIVLVAVLVCYLKMEVVYEQSFTVDCSPSKSVIFDFLKTPSNLERIHPRIQEVLDIQTDNSTTSFLIQEDMGVLFGSRTFPMNLTTFSLSQVTSCISLDSSSIVADVTVTLSISDYDTLQPASETNPLMSRDVPSATIQGRVKVKSMRILTYIITSFVLNVWQITISSAIDLLQKESNNPSQTKPPKLH
ncbi:hypothetical protein BsWGS_05488 [Bradybaena similaris]